MEKIILEKYIRSCISDMKSYLRKGNCFREIQAEAEDIINRINQFQEREQNNE